MRQQFLSDLWLYVSLNYWFIWYLSQSQKKETDELANDFDDFSLTKKKKKKPVNIDDLDNVSVLRIHSTSNDESSGLLINSCCAHVKFFDISLQIISKFLKISYKLKIGHDIESLNIIYTCITEDIV
jgi:hypothetical protein